MTNKKDCNGELRSDLILKVDLSELGLGKHELEYDPARPGEKEEAERQIARIQALTKTAMPAVAVPVTRATGPTLSQMVDEFLSDGETRRRQDKAATVRKDKDALALFSAGRRS